MGLVTPVKRPAFLGAENWCWNRRGLAVCVTVTVGVTVGRTVGETAGVTVEWQMLWHI